MAVATTAGDSQHRQDDSFERDAAGADLLRRPELVSVFAVLAVGCSALIGLRAINDNSFLTHLATGELILDSGSVPTADPYSYTSGGTEWVVQSWLASLVYGVVDQAFGATGLRVLMGLLTAGLGWMSWRLTAATDLVVVRAAALAATLVVGGAMWSERPLLFGLLAFGATLICLTEERSPWWIVPLYWLWVNTHGSYPLGLVLIGAVVVGRHLDRLEASAAVRLGRLAIVGIAVGGLLNPYGPKILTFPIRLLGRSETLRYIREWQSPDFNLTWTKVFAALVLGAVAALMLRTAWRFAVPLAVFFGAALLATRNIGLAAFVALPAIAFGFGSGDSSRPKPEPRIALLPVALAVALGAVGVISLGGPNYSVARYPVEAVDWLEGEGLRDGEFRLAHSDVVGNYLTIAYGDQARVFIDDRFEVHSDEVIEDYIVLRDGTAEWVSVLERWDIDALLWDRNAALPQLAGAELGWTAEYTDEDWTIVCRPGSCP